MKWNVQITRNAEKQLKQLPEGIRKKIVALILEIELGGPVRGNWPNYGSWMIPGTIAISGKASHVMWQSGRLQTHLSNPKTSVIDVKELPQLALLFFTFNML